MQLMRLVLLSNKKFKRHLGPVSSTQNYTTEGGADDNGDERWKTEADGIAMMMMETLMMSGSSQQLQVQPGP